eukprot:COSAG04_NODE_3864_length_2464_cov_2.195349_3_plen_151_part_01
MSASQEVEMGEARPLTPAQPGQAQASSAGGAAKAMDVDSGSMDARWRDIYRFCKHDGPMALYEAAGIEAGQEVADGLHACKVLVIGAGGLGCELLKFFNDTATTEIYTALTTLSLHGALPTASSDGWDAARSWRTAAVSPASAAFLSASSF